MSKEESEKTFCTGCYYRKEGEPWYINICLLDDSEDCPRDEEMNENHIL